MKNKTKMETYTQRWLGGITDAMDTTSGKLRETVRAREAWHTAVHGAAESPTGLGDRTTAHTEVKDKKADDGEALSRLHSLGYSM